MGRKESNQTKSKLSDKLTLLLYHITQIYTILKNCNPN